MDSHVQPKDPPTEGDKSFLQFPAVSMQQIELGAIIGNGTFSKVYRVRYFVNAEAKRQSWNRRDSMISMNSHSTLQPDLLARSCSNIHDDCPVTVSSLCVHQEEFALKKLSDRTLADPLLCDAAARDLATEATILCKLPPHDNIVALHALSDGFWNDSSNGFLILTLLYESLENRLDRWRRQGLSFNLVFCSLKERILALLTPFRPRALTPFSDKVSLPLSQGGQCNRCTKIALPVARAMAFLHHHRICYRDLKPSNVGFAPDGSVRLFDFGFSREMASHDTDRAMTQLTGTPRYMAPEIMKCEDYSTPADVYSYSVLLWELLTLCRPFAHASTWDRAKHLIAHKQQRPSLRGIKDNHLKQLLQVGWHPNPNMRPSFALIVHELETVFANCSRQRT